MKYETQQIELPIGYLLNNVRDWDAFCAETGLNPWVLKEGLAVSEDNYSVSIEVLKKHGILI